MMSEDRERCLPERRNGGCCKDRVNAEEEKKKKRKGTRERGACEQNL